jgi:hypothetical protein
MDSYEILVRWYLRFNGFFSVENFIIHEPVSDGNRAGGETDIIAVRFPYSREEVMEGFTIPNDGKLFDQEASEKKLTEFIIAEVKSGDSPRSNLNKVWTKSDKLYLDRIAYLIRWMGMFDNEDTIYKVATELKDEYRCQEDRYLIRLIYFAKEKKSHIKKLGIPQITFADIFEFIYRLRTPSFKTQGLGVRSPHTQWHPLIKQVWEIGNPESPYDDEKKAQQMLKLLENNVNDEAG